MIMMCKLCRRCYDTSCMVDHTCMTCNIASLKNEIKRLKYNNSKNCCEKTNFNNSKCCKQTEKTHIIRGPAGPQGKQGNPGIPGLTGPRGSDGHVGIPVILTLQELNNTQPDEEKCKIYILPI